MTNSASEKPQGHPLCSIVKLGFYSVLASLAISDLVSSSFKVVQYLRTPGVVAGVAFDSFSDSSTATAVLKQRAETLLFNYTESRDAVWEKTRGLTGEPTQPAALGPKRIEQAMFDGCPRGSALDMSQIRPLEKLQTTIEDLHLDLYQKLLVIYWENHYDDELINVFLRLAQDTPERPEILEWVRIALDRSQPCHRTEEVRDVLQHVLRFHSDLKTAGQIEVLLKTWTNDQQRGSG